MEPEYSQTLFRPDQQVGWKPDDDKPFRNVPREWYEIYGPGPFPLIRVKDIDDFDPKFQLHPQLLLIRTRIGELWLSAGYFVIHPTAAA